MVGNNKNASNIINGYRNGAGIVLRSEIKMKEIIVRKINNDWPDFI